MGIPFPDIDPVIFEIGPFALRWYALGYIGGLVFAWWYVRRMLADTTLWQAAPFNGQAPAKNEDIDDLIVWATLGVIAGGRIGYLLFYGFVYSPGYYFENPLRIFALWEGGMSFHGGALGVIVAVIVFSMRRGLDMVMLGDLVAAATPIGIFLVRMTNFVNAELWGKPADVPWAVVFCNETIRAAHGGTCPAGDMPRHPSQIYEGLLEGLVIFVVLRLMIKTFSALNRPGLVIAAFMGLYGLFRILVEIFFRDSDQLVGGTALTMGTLLSLPMLLGAAFFFWYSQRKPA